MKRIVNYTRYFVIALIVINIVKFKISISEFSKLGNAAVENKDIPIVFALFVFKIFLLFIVFLLVNKWYRKLKAIDEIKKKSGVFEIDKKQKQKSKSDKCAHEGISIYNSVYIPNPYAGIFISGGAGSGKSKSFIEPIIYDCASNNFTGVLYDFKFPSLANHVYQAYKTTGIKVSYINFTDVNFSNRINPIAPKYINTSNHARELAIAIVNNLMPETIRKPDFWSRNTEALLTAVIWYLREEQPQYCTFPHVIGLLLARRTDDLMNMLKKNDQCADMISPIVESLERKASNQTAGILATLQVLLANLSTPEIFWVLSGNEVEIRTNLKDKPGFIVVGNEPTLSDTFSPLIGLILTSVAKQLNQVNDQKSIIILDEAPTVYLPKFEQIPATARSNKVATVFCAQDISQIIDKYGEEKTESILSNLGNQFYGRTTNPKTAERVSKVFGKSEKQIGTYTQGRSKNQSPLDFYSTSQNGHSITLQERDNVKVQDVAQLPTGSFYCILSEGNNRLFNTKIITNNTTANESVMIEKLNAVTKDDLISNYKKVKAEVKYLIDSQ
jgi:type IV secretory pathway TraG/TraD family ATPase VirD4